MALTPENSVKVTTTQNAHLITPKSKVPKRSSAAKRHEKSIEHSAKLAKISEEDCDIRKKYYEAKLMLYEKEILLKERDVIAKDSIASALEQLIKLKMLDFPFEIIVYAHIMQHCTSINNFCAFIRTIM